MIPGDGVTIGPALEPPSFEASLMAVTADGERVGTCGLRDGSPEHRRATAFADVPARYREATLRALCRWAFDVVNLAKVEAYVTDDDLPLYESLGFVREVHRRRALWAHGGWHDQHLVGLLREELT